MREGLCMGLGGAFEYSHASTAQELVNEFRTTRPDAVLMAADIDCGKGPELCEQLRLSAGGAFTPIYLFGDDDDDELIRRSFDKGASDYLVSPVHLGVLARRMMRDIGVSEPSGAGQSCATAAWESALFRAMPVSAILCDEAGQVLASNIAFAERFGCAGWKQGTSLSELFKVADLGSILRSKGLRAELNCLSSGPVAVSISAERLGDGESAAKTVLFISDCEPDSSSAANVEPFKRQRVIVLEDYEVVSRSLRRLLERDGHRVDVALSADEALRVFSDAIRREDPFTIAVLDLSVPGSAGGAEVLASMRALAPQVKGIVMSGAWSDPAMQKPAEHGFDAVLRKPFNRDELRKAVAEALSSLQM